MDRNMRCQASKASTPGGVAVTGAVACCCAVHASLLHLAGLCDLNACLGNADTCCSPRRGTLRRLAVLHARPRACICRLLMARTMHDDDMAYNETNAAPVIFNQA